MCYQIGGPPQDPGPAADGHAQIGQGGRLQNAENGPVVTGHTLSALGGCSSPRKHVQNTEMFDFRYTRRQQKRIR